MIHLHSLGQCEIEIGDARLTPSAQTLFATALYLAVEGGRPIPREQLLGFLWPDVDDDKATHSLRQMFYRLRSYGLPLDGDSLSVVLPPGSVHTDYESLLERGANVPVDQLLARIPGGFLPGYMPRSARPFAEWVEAQRALVNATLRRQLVGGITLFKAAGDWPAAQTLAQRCLELDPLNEEATLAYAEALAMDGSKARAIMVIDRYMNEVGPRAKEMHLPATMLRTRISELYPLPPVIERDPPHTGREAQMEKLDAALKDARQGTGSAFLISGPPGIGKTRLVTEFARAAQLQGIRIARANMGHHDGHRPLGAWSDLVPLMQRMPGAVGCEPESLPFLKRLTSHDSQTSAPSGEWQDAEYVFARIRHSILDLVAAVASESCIILLIEDTHWMDEWSWDVIVALTKRLEKLGVLLLMTWRDGEVPDTSVRSNALISTMPLASLDDQRCRKLLGAVGPASRVSEEEFVEWCVRTSTGNPYFLIELGRRASNTDGRFQAPPSLTRLVAQRFADVAPLSRRVLQAAAVLGKNSTLVRLERVLDERRVALLDSLDELACHSLILSDGDRVVCRHDLLGMSALTDISPLSLQLLHRHAAQVLEAEITASSTPAHLWDCAMHWEAAGDVDLAIRMIDRCASIAISVGAPLEAARVLAYATQLLPPTDARCEMQHRLIFALYQSREYTKVVEVAEEVRSYRAIKGVCRHDHTPEELMALDALAFTSGPSQRTLDALIGCGRDPLATANHRVQAASFACKIASEIFDPAAGRAALANVQSSIDSARVDLREYLRLIFHGSFGPTALAARAARELCSLLTHSDLLLQRAHWLPNCAFGFFLDGDLATAIQCANESVQIYTDLQMPAAVKSAASRLCMLYLAVGDLDAASDALRLERFEGARRGLAEARSFVDHSLRLALLRGETHELAALLGRFADIELPTWPRGVVHTKALVSLARILQGWRPTDDDMRELLGLHYLARSHALHDFYVYMLVHAFESRSEAEVGVTLAREYIAHYRFERSPLLRQLGEALSRISSGATFGAGASAQSCT